MSSGYRMRNSAEEIIKTVVTDRPLREVTRRAPAARAGQVKTRSGAVAAPRNLTAVQGATKAVRLRWDPSSWTTVDDYIVEIATDASFVGAVERCTREVSYIWDEGSAATTYYFRIKTRAVGGEISTPGNTASFDIP